MSCEICHSLYDRVNCTPLLLPTCGHSFCRNCIQDLCHYGKIECKICGTLTFCKNIEDLPKNISILEFIENSQNKSVFSQMIKESDTSFLLDDSLFKKNFNPKGKSITTISKISGTSIFLNKLGEKNVICQMHQNYFEAFCFED